MLDWYSSPKSLSSVVRSPVRTTASVPVCIPLVGLARTLGPSRDMLGWQHSGSGRRSRRRASELLDLYLRLVSLGIRYSYLLDSVGRWEEEEILDKMAEMEVEDVLLCRLDEEVVLVNRRILEQRLVGPMDVMVIHPLVVHMKLTQIDIMSSHESDLLFDKIIAIFAKTSLSKSSIRISSQEICLPYLTGWLLGYPILYYFDSSDESNLLRNALTIQSLHKVSINGVLPYANISVDLLEFTYPLCIIEVEDVEERIQNRFREIKKAVESQPEVIAEVGMSRSVEQPSSLVF